MSLCLRLPPPLSPFAVPTALTPSHPAENAQWLTNLLWHAASLFVLIFPSCPFFVFSCFSRASFLSRMARSLDVKRYDPSSDCRSSTHAETPVAVPVPLGCKCAMLPFHLIELLPTKCFGSLDSFLQEYGGRCMYMQTAQFAIQFQDWPGTAT